MSYYPKCDTSIWLRSAKDEVKNPIKGTLNFGTLPPWLSGTLLRNGPGGPDVYGPKKCKHLFDGPGLLHKFSLQPPNVFYTNRFIRTKAYTKNITARRLILSEFGTFATPDPCRRIFSRVSALFNFNMDKILTDTANISVTTFGDEIYCLAETPFAHRIDIKTLKTINTINVHSEFGIINHSSHPHCEGRNVYNLGQKLSPWYGPHYIIAQMENKKENDGKKEENGDKNGQNCSKREGNDDQNCKNKSPEMCSSPWSTAKELCKIPSRWPLSICYMHSFSITPNYFIIIEQPLSISLLSIPYNIVWGEKPVASCLQFFPEEETIFHVVSRENGTRRKFHSPSFFFLHTINAFETVDEETGRDVIVVDICTYKDSKMIDCMYIEALRNANKNPDYAKLFRSRPKRFYLDIGGNGEESEDENLLFSRTVECEIIVDIGCETPQIYYEKYNGQPYKYFYAISSDVDAENPGTIIKVNTEARTFERWSIQNGYPSEPIFHPYPDSKSEDDGIILSAILYGGDENSGLMSLVILDCKKLELLTKFDFETGAPIPKCLHGSFFPTQKYEEEQKS